MAVELEDRFSSEGSGGMHHDGECVIDHVATRADNLSVIEPVRVPFHWRRFSKNHARDGFRGGSTYANNSNRPWAARCGDGGNRVSNVHGLGVTAPAQGYGCEARESVRLPPRPRLGVII